ncbi:hypothetical protein D9756_005637 [Leucocoprinus leucothites]|uniref:BTB domain-containing protein n=1 Tax=Leucocoprinus leucothites TaxID=201217 RepID=A0A8H5D8S9_9AGAR|nr:hypothetical protein D9756_005637 [Leucoagaricus leucothites]
MGGTLQLVSAQNDPPLTSSNPTETLTVMSPLKPSVLQNTYKGLSLNKQYYLPNADLHFQVEQTLFRVHSYFFTRESPQFRERMAGVDCARSNTHDGRSDQTAISVKNTSVEDFSDFLWVFYDPSYMYNAPATIWSVVLTLSSPTRWDFPKVQTLALHHLNKLSLPVVDRIVLYKSCSVSFEHLLPLYVELCTREESLSLEESIRLGWDLAVPIVQIRELLLKGKGNTSSDALHDMDVAVEGVPEKWIQDRIKSMLNNTQEMTSLMDMQDHRCPLHHEVQSQLFDLCNDKTKTAAGTRFRSSPRIFEGAAAIEAKPGPSKSKAPAQAIDHAQKFVQKMVKTVESRKSPPVVNA